MNENRVKRIMREGGLALGTYTGGIADPQIVEIRHDSTQGPHGVVESGRA